MPGTRATFLTQMEEVLGACLERGIKIVTNAGGLNPRALADRLGELGERSGAQPQSPSSRATTSSTGSPELQQRGVRFDAPRHAASRSPAQA